MIEIAVKFSEAFLWIGDFRFLLVNFWKGVSKVTFKTGGLYIWEGAQNPYNS